MIYKIFKKDLRLFFGDKRGVLLTFILPIMLISLFTFAFGGTSNKQVNERKLTLLIADNDQSESSQGFIETLNGVPMINVKMTDEAAGVNAVSKGDQLAVLIFNKGFQNTINQEDLGMELKFDAVKSIESNMLIAMLDQLLLTKVKSNQNSAFMDQFLALHWPSLQGEEKSKLRKALRENYRRSTLLKIKASPVRKEEKSTGNLSLIQSVAGTAIMMLLFSITAIGAGLLDEKEAGTLKRLLGSPLKSNHILLGKMLAGFVLSVLQLIVMLLFAWVAFGLPIWKDPMSLGVLILCVAFAVGSFGIFIVALVKTRQQLNGFSTLIILFMSALGGSMIPTFIMPDIMQTIGKFTVNYWGIQGFFDIFWRELSFMEIVPKMGVLIGIGVVISLISLRLFSRNLVKIAA